MGRDFLSQSERERFNSFPSPMAEQDIIQFFTLSECDKELIGRRRGDHNRLGFALQLCALRFLGFVPEKLGQADKSALRFLARGLGIEPRGLGAYATRAQTRSDHLAEIIVYLGFVSCDAAHLSNLQTWLNERALEHDKTTILLEQAIGWLRARKIVRPIGLSTLETVVINARNDAEHKTYDTIKPFLTTFNTSFLKRVLCKMPLGDRSHLQWLTSRERSNSPSALVATIERLEFLKRYRVHKWNLAGLHPNRRKRLAQIGRRSTAQAIARMPPEKRFPVLISFLVESVEDITDDLLEMFDHNLANIHSKAKRELVEFRVSTARTMDDKLRMFAKMASLVLNHGISDVSLRKTIYSHVDKKSLQSALVDCDRITRPLDNSVWDFFGNRYSHIRQFSQKFLNVLRFETTENYSDLQKALHHIRMVDEGNWPDLPKNSPTDFITKTWREFVFDDEGLIRRRFYEMCALWELRLGLRSGEVWSPHSKKHSNPAGWLIPTSCWPEVRREYLALVRFPETWQEKFRSCRKEFLATLPAIRRELKKGTEIRVDDDELVITPIKGGDEPNSTRTLQEEIASRLPQIELTDLLVEVDSWIHFSDCFSHAGGEESRLDDFQKRVYVSLFSGACNLEQGRLASQAGLSSDQLRWFMTWFLREETLQAAINMTVDYQFNNPFSKHFGSGTMSSSDGQRFPVPVKSRNAVALPKYYGHGQGLTFYSWTSDLFPQFGVKVIPSTTRDATYIFDAICGNETDLPVAEHTTDTSGHTALVFAMADLLGIEFCPRIRDVADQRLLRIDGITVKDLGKAKAIFKKSARFREKIVSHYWDEILRLGGSVKMGYVTASLLISRLQAFPRKSALVQALIEYGRLRKTIFILRYIGSQIYRRRIGKQLNKGEQVHDLKSFIAFGREGQIRKSQLENQMNQAGCLTLVSNLVILWNTRYIEEVVRTLKSEGWAISDEDISHISPCRFEHINRYGRFSFDFENVPQNGQLRPLRSPEKIA